MPLTSKHFFPKLRKLNLPPSTVRELIQASEGMKICRTFASDEQLLDLIPLFERFNLHVAFSGKKFLFSPDQNKGGFSNRPGQAVPATLTIGSYCIYVGRDPIQVKNAVDNEELGLDYEFGSQLKIPACCISFYERYYQRASEKQTDFLPFTFAQTTDSWPFDPLTNMAPQYFGYSLNSFFPCSFKCEHASRVAGKVEKLLRSVDSNFADEFMRYQHMNYLYTEYDGVFGLEDSFLNGKVLKYKSGFLKGTTTGVVWSALRRGNQIRILAKDHYLIQNDDHVLLDLEGELVSLLIFSTNNEDGDAPSNFA
jgi:hypothetical protein